MLFSILFSTEQLAEPGVNPCEASISVPPFGSAESRDFSGVLPMRWSEITVAGRWKDGAIAQPSTSFWIIALRGNSSVAQTLLSYLPGVRDELAQRPTIFSSRASTPI